MTGLLLGSHTGWTIGWSIGIAVVFVVVALVVPILLLGPSYCRTGDRHQRFSDEVGGPHGITRRAQHHDRGGRGHSRRTGPRS